MVNELRPLNYEYWNLNQTTQKISWFVWYFYSSTSIKAKLFVLFHAIEKAWNEGFSVLICDTDSKMALELIDSSMDIFHPCFPLISAIKKLLHLDWTITLKYTLREANSCADWLAKMELLMMIFSSIGRTVHLKKLCSC